MNRSRLRISHSFTVALVAAALTAATINIAAQPSLAQQGGFGGRRGGGMRQPPAPLNAASFTLDALTKTLTLTSDEQSKIKPILDGVKKERDDDRAEMMKMFQSARAGGGAGGRPQMDPQAMQAMQAKNLAFQEDEKKADRDINESLTPTQRDILHGLVKDANLFRTVGLPYQTIGDIAVTDDERKALNSLSDDMRRAQLKAQAAQADGTRPDREAMRKEREDNLAKALAALTPDHKAIVEAYNKANPQTQGFGGGGGGRRGGGAAGAPPPTE